MTKQNRPTRKATLPTENTMNGQWPDKKEQIEAWQVVAFKGGKFHTPVTARLFMGRSGQASKVYASIWTHAENVSFNGHGSAGGYGYDKKSAALADAIKSTGIVLDKSIHGVGESAMQDALSAIAFALGYRVFHVVRL